MVTGKGGLSGTLFHIARLGLWGDFFYSFLGVVSHPAPASSLHCPSKVSGHLECGSPVSPPVLRASIVSSLGPAWQEALATRATPPLPISISLITL